MTWRVGRKVPINVYDGDRPVCQCHTVEDAKRIVDAMNLAQIMGARADTRKKQRDSRAARPWNSDAPEDARKKPHGTQP